MPRMLGLFRPVGCLFTLIGAGVIVFGGSIAVMALAGMYGHALSADPLAQPEMSEDETSSEMIRGVIIGAVGVPFIVIGTVLLKASFMRSFAAILARSAAPAAQAAPGPSNADPNEQLLRELTEEIDREGSG